MSVRSWFFVGALAGSAPAAVTALVVLTPTYIPVYVGILWGLAAMVTVLLDTVRTLQPAEPGRLEDMPRRPFPVVAPLEEVIHAGEVVATADVAEPRAPTNSIFFSRAGAPAGTAPRRSSGAARAAGVEAMLADFAAWHGNGEEVKEGKQESGGVPWDGFRPPAAPPAVELEVGEDVEMGRGLLHRRRPLPAEYDFIFQTWQSSATQNAALRALWGSKDGRTFGWLKQVLTYFQEYSALPIWAYEVLIAAAESDDPVAIAARCGHEVQDLASATAELAEYNIVRCSVCGRWFEAEQQDLDDGLLSCEQCREG